jgi:thymidine phosphorylase
MDKGAGVDILKRLGDTVISGQSLYRIHAAFPSNFDYAQRYALAGSGYTIGTAAELPQVYVEF